VVPAARVAAKLVLNALRTAECGSAAAISAAAELSAGTVRESKVWKSKVTRQDFLLHGGTLPSGTARCHRHGRPGRASPAPIATARMRHARTGRVRVLVG
jgi:hypothetical protein